MQLTSSLPCVKQLECVTQFVFSHILQRGCSVLEGIPVRGGSRNSSTGGGGGGFWAGILRGGGGLGSRSAGIFIY